MDIMTLSLKIITITSLFSLVTCDTQQVTLRFNIPDMMLSSLLAVDHAIQKFRSSDAVVDFSKIAQNILMRVNWEGVSSMLEELVPRRTNEEPRPMVELAPGTFKTEILSYPPNFFTNRLKNLLKIKAREEKRNKDLNAPK